MLTQPTEQQIKKKHSVIYLYIPQEKDMRVGEEAEGNGRGVGLWNVEGRQGQGHREGRRVRGWEGDRETDKETREGVDATAEEARKNGEKGKRIKRRASFSVLGRKAKWRLSSKEPILPQQYSPGSAPALPHRPGLQGQPFWPLDAGL